MFEMPGYEDYFARSVSSLLESVLRDQMVSGAPKQEQINTIASHEVSTSKQGANEGGTFTSHLYQVNECLDLLKVVRKVKKMTAFYQTCDQLGEVSQAVAYARNAINHEPEQARIIEKLCDTACTALNHLESAYQALAQLDDPAKRDHQVDQFLGLAKQFEPETRMLPQSEVSDKSIWSDIYNLMEKCEALRQCQAASNSVSTAGTNKAIRSQRIKKP